MEKHVVFLLHGIRTQAEWAQRAASIIESDETMVARPIRYGFFDVVRFLLPAQRFRDKPIKRVTRLLRDEISRQPQAISVIAHSFGSYILSKIIENETDIKFRRIILCGSIVPESFEWEKHIHRIGTPRDVWHVVCDCGVKDVWPVIAHTITWGYGSSGRFGFGHNRVKDRFFNLGHSEFFTSEFIKTYWLPYLSNGIIRSGEINRPTTPWQLSITTVVKIKWVILATLLAILMWLATGIFLRDREADTVITRPATIVSWPTLNTFAEETELKTDSPHQAGLDFLGKATVLKGKVQIISISMHLNFDNNGNVIPGSTAAGLRFYDDWENPTAYFLGLSQGRVPNGTMSGSHVLVTFSDANESVTITGDISGNVFNGRVTYGNGKFLGQFTTSVDGAIHSLLAD